MFGRVFRRARGSRRDQRPLRAGKPRRSAMRETKGTGNNGGVGVVNRRRGDRLVRESQAGHLQVKLREIDIAVKREWLTASSYAVWRLG